MQSLLNYINQYRKSDTNKKFLKSFYILCSIIIIIFILLCFIESIFYLTSYNRRNYIILLLSIFTTSILFLFGRWAINYYKLFSNNIDEKIANSLGKQIPEIKDQLLNAIQLNKTHPDLDLTKLAIQNIKSKLDIFYNSKKIVINPKKERKVLIVTVLMLILIILIPSINSSAFRVINYQQNFNPPTPFKINDINNNSSALSGDTIQLKFDIIGAYPDSIKLYLKQQDNIKIQNLKNINNNFSYNINNIRSNLIYWTKYESNSLFSAWDSIGTKPQKIIVKDRPIIIKNDFTIIPPEYTNEAVIEYTDQSLTQFEVTDGSIIKFNLETNKALSKSWMLLNNNRYNLTIDNNFIKGDFLIDENKTLQVFCLDNSLIPNLNPTQFTFLNIKDTPPTIIVNSPNQEFEIDESYNIYTNLNINDNYAINEVSIEYKIISPDFKNEYIINRISLNENFVQGSKEINIIYDWEIDDLGLLMGDEIHFWFLANDNNPNNTNQVKTDVFIGKFPSLEDLFLDIEEYEQESEAWLEDIKESIDEISDITDEVELELLKNNDIGFENEKKLEESFEKIEDITEEIEKLQNNIDKIIEQAEKNNLFDENLLEKFNDFQTLLQNIMTPEIMEAMNKLQDALKNMNAEDISKALDNFEFNMEEFEDQLDRFIDMFKMAQAEQLLNELSKMAEDLINKQTDLINELSENPSKNNLLNSKSTRQQKRFENLKSKLSQAKNEISNLSDETAKELDKLESSKKIKDTENSMTKTSQNINNKNIEGASNQSKDVKTGLEEIEQEISQIQESFIKSSMDELNNDFFNIISNIITIANQQENLILKSDGIRSNSPKIREINNGQNNIKREINQLMGHLIELSTKTFFVNPSINRAFGKISSLTASSINNFEQKKINSALKEQKEALEYINLATLLLLESIKEMNDSNSPSGFEKFMEQMEQMSQQQQGINQATMQFNPLGMMQQEDLLGELQSQQQQLKQQLDDLLGDFPGRNNGTMEKIGEDMDEIIEDFKNKRITRETIDRQQQILSRMLDNQKSLTQKDYSNKRQSKIGGNFSYDGNERIDSKLGNKDLLFINAMESAMDEGYSNEYNKIIRNYFLKLQSNEKEK